VYFFSLSFAIRGTVLVAGPPTASLASWPWLNLAAIDAVILKQKHL
jgi:hypothetical protein